MKKPQKGETLAGARHGPKPLVARAYLSDKLRLTHYAPPPGIGTKNSTNSLIVGASQEVGSR